MNKHRLHINKVCEKAQLILHTRIKKRNSDNNKQTFKLDREVGSESFKNIKIHKMDETVICTYNKRFRPIKHCFKNLETYKKLN